jgi:hypothetical protein
MPWVRSGGILRRLIGVILGVALLVDPTWIAGLYDAGDYDDVVLLATASSDTLGPPLEDPVSVWQAIQVRRTQSGERLVVKGRAPPIA